MTSLDIAGPAMTSPKERTHEVVLLSGASPEAEDNNASELLGQSIRSADFAGIATEEVEGNLRCLAFQCIKKWSFVIFLVLVFLGTSVLIGLSYSGRQIGFEDDWKAVAKYLSMPIVSLLFTWWHVWFGIQMCFYPVEFKGCCAPYLGWQGIVPRRAHIMASRSCDVMIGTLITAEEIVGRIDATQLFERLDAVLSQVNVAIINRLASQYMPKTWEMVPAWCKEELHIKAMEESKLVLRPVIEDIKKGINEIVDVKEMAVAVLVDNKPLLVETFVSMAGHELKFIQHFSAVMGFFLGIVQMFLWIFISSTGGSEECSAGDKAFKCWAGYVILPMSGLFIGYFTNWLGIAMIFRPAKPRRICYVFQVQGVFLKRQQAVAQDLARVVSERLIHTERMLEYVLNRSTVMDNIFAIVEKHMRNMVDDKKSSFGLGGAVLPHIFGECYMESMKKDILEEAFLALPQHREQIQSYLDETFNMRETLAYRLSRLSPEAFAGMLRPVFQEDEWMILLLGGVLGVAVGTLQALMLGGRAG